MRHGLSLPNVGTATELVELAMKAEDSGWDGVFFWDHLHLRRDLRLDVLDPWVLLGAVAHATSRVRLGVLVTPLARRRPWKVAKEVVTVDHLSGGRVVIGVGLGTPPDDEFGAFGDPTNARERAALLDDGLAVLDGLLTGEPFVHDGPHFHVDAELRPAPIQRPRPPIWVAGVLPHRRPFERARHWDGVMPLSADELMTPDQVREVLAITGTRNGFDVVVSPVPSFPPAAFEDAGATWLIASAPPWIPDWQLELQVLAERGPTDG